MGIRILHIIQHLSLGGAARAMLAVCKYTPRYGQFTHRIISLIPADGDAWRQAAEIGATVISSPTAHRMRKEIIDTDLIHIHYWNNPELINLIHEELPPTRILVWAHVAGDIPPQVVPVALVDWGDRILYCTEYSYTTKGFKSLSNEQKSKVGAILAGSDFDRLLDYKPRPHRGFNVGYIGTLHPIKMHPDFIRMSSLVNIPGVNFIVCGSGDSAWLQSQAEMFKASDRFEFPGYVEDIRSVLEELDVFGYPLSERSYAAAELTLQEAMAAAIPPVVFSVGGISSMVANNETGLVVHTPEEYSNAIAYLYKHPEVRHRLGNNARKWAMKYFGAENSSRQMSVEYQNLYSSQMSHHLWPGEKSSSPNHYFIDSLGEMGGLFKDSMEGNLESDLLIAESTEGLRSDGAGGILHYRNFFPLDGWLRIWSGLVEECQGDLISALIDYQVAFYLLPEVGRVTVYRDRVLSKLVKDSDKASFLDLLERAAIGTVELAKQKQRQSESHERIDQLGDDLLSAKGLIHSVRSSKATRLIRKIGFWKWFDK